MPAAPSKTTNDSPQQLSNGLRTFISLLLFVQLFALAVVVLAHTGQSELTAQIRRRVPLLQPYMRRVWMDHTYTYADYVNPHQDAQLDSQYVIEVEYEMAGGKLLSLTLPDSRIRPDTRRRRYLALARNFAAVVGSDVEAQYAGMLASGLLAEVPEATSLRIACIQQYTPSTSDEPPDNLNAVLHEDGAYSATVYRCEAWINDEDGAVEVSKLEEARRVAPVNRQQRQNQQP